jgi:hypothetical protein
VDGIFTWRFSGFHSKLRCFLTTIENSKSKIQNRKLVGIVALVVTFAMCEAVAQAQQPKKVPRIGYLSSSDPATEAARFEAIGWLCASWAT